MIKSFIKKILAWSPIALTKNMAYDQQTKKIINLLPNDANCIDVGCFKGEIMDLMLAAAPNGHHIGFEPIPEQYDFLTKKYADTTNCTIYNFAASNEEGESTFNHVTSNPSYSGLRKRDYDHPNEEDQTITVNTAKIDDLVDLTTKIDFIKIDVEGAELLVLQGADKIITAHKPTVVFEYGLGAADHYNATPDKIFDFFNERGLKLSTLEQFFSGKKTFRLEDFSDHFYQRKDYYFVAYH